MKKYKRRFKAVLFDMDGVIIDSEWYWTKTEKEFAQKNGLVYNQAYRRRIMALSPPELAKTLRQFFGLKKSEKQIMKERDQMALDIYKKKAKLLPGFLPLVKKVFAKGGSRSIALVSSSPWHWIQPILRRFKLKKYFEQIISAEEMKDKRGKPHPAIYLFTARRLKVKPKDCLVFEDSINGIKAAKAAGMFCVAVPDRRWIKDRRGMGEADLVVESLGDKKLLNLFNENFKSQAPDSKNK